MPHWMAKLTAHHAQMRRAYPDDQLMIVFDIDGTILDLRHMILYLLQRYDREHGCELFRDLSLHDIDIHENVISDFLRRLGLSESACTEVETWYRQRYWSSETIATSHYAFTGALDVIRWFQLQPQTTVSLNTGRFEQLRKDTLLSLNKLGQTHGVYFANELLYMRPQGWSEGVVARKVEGVRHYQALGYRICAFVDNEPENLAAIAAADPAGEILLLHPDTIFLSPLTSLPPRAVQGDHYDLAQLITAANLPPALQLVWHGVNDAQNLRQFLASDVVWAELDVNIDPDTQTLILRHDTLAESPAAEGEVWLRLDETLAKLRTADRSLKLDFKVGDGWIERCLTLVAEFKFDPTRLWFNADHKILHEQWLRRLAAAYPQSVRQIPIGFLRGLVDQPDQLRTAITRLADWGVNRFSLNWRHAETRRLCTQLTSWGYAVNLYGVADLHEFLQAVLLQPTAITADFNFPAWGYYGRGSGQHGVYHQYRLLAPNDIACT